MNAFIASNESVCATPLYIQYHTADERAHRYLRDSLCCTVTATQLQIQYHTADEHVYR